MAEFRAEAELVAKPLHRAWRQAAIQGLHVFLQVILQELKHKHKLAWRAANVQ
eukprot:CAMPEP_0172853522 /NCGR_PEP_ID=MMETSP1075-20121228/57186_1 /TAXON_ID=2916 /ORGANISM="Ceratium fusus, Strain PA161109" /LENGTH=52 /DNA_ID=CAMNT_0013700027 /DNA_START=377 /DNA_END=535 /DNA_ORIENTATION=+